MTEESHRWAGAVCADCGYTCGHTGGTASCTETAVCAICQIAYGEKNPDNHTGQRAWVQTEDSHEELYLCCGKVTVSRSGHEWKDGSCTGCGYHCKHTVTEIRDSISETCTTNGDTGDEYCEICGERLSAGEVVEAGGHKGGTATCVAKAVCQVCHEQYGETAPNHHAGLVKTKAVPATAARSGNIEYWRCAACGKLFADAGGKKEITKADTVTRKLPPVIIGGRDALWEKGSREGLRFESDGAFADFVEVLVDDKVISADNYQKWEGSIVIELKADYLATLTEGSHTLIIRSTGGDAATGFTVKAKPAEESVTEPVAETPAPTPASTPESEKATAVPAAADTVPAPEDSTNVWVWAGIGLAALCAGAGACALVIRKRKG